MASPPFSVQKFLFRNGNSRFCAIEFRQSNVRRTKKKRRNDEKKKKEREKKRIDSFCRILERRRSERCRPISPRILAHLFPRNEKRERIQRLEAVKGNRADITLSISSGSSTPGRARHFAVINYGHGIAKGRRGKVQGTLHFGYGSRARGWYRLVQQEQNV